MTLDEARDYVRKSIEGFERDPADSEFQRGYLAALMAVWTEALKQSKPHAVPFRDTPAH